MATPSPPPLTPTERRARRNLVARLARRLGFVGRVEYRHVYSQTGGAQYGRGSTAEEDLLTVYAEAFERDANPDDFALEAILAHERGHQLMAASTNRQESPGACLRSQRRDSGIASGAMICTAEADRDALTAKATVELLDHGETLENLFRKGARKPRPYEKPAVGAGFPRPFGTDSEIATQRLQELWNLLEALL